MSLYSDRETSKYSQSLRERTADKPPKWSSYWGAIFLCRSPNFVILVNPVGKHASGKGRQMRVRFAHLPDPKRGGSLPTSRLVWTHVTHHDSSQSEIRQCNTVPLRGQGVAEPPEGVGERRSITVSMAKRDRRIYVFGSSKSKRNPMNETQLTYQT